MKILFYFIFLNNFFIFLFYFYFLFFILILLLVYVEEILINFHVQGHFLFLICDYNF